MCPEQQQFVCFVWKKGTDDFDVKSEKDTYHDQIMESLKTLAMKKIHDTTIDYLSKNVTLTISEWKDKLQELPKCMKEEMVHDATEMFKINLLSGLTWLGIIYGLHCFKKFKEGKLLESLIDRYLHIMKLRLKFHTVIDTIK